MFARIKKSGNYQYVQVVHNERIDGKVRQRVIATLGRLDVLKETGQLDQLLESLARLSDHAAVLHALRTNQITASSTVHLGPPLVFEKLWKQVGMPDILCGLLEGRRFEFPLERVVFITVLHRLFAPGSDRAAERWCRKYALGDLGNLDLQHFYRTMGWLGEPLPDRQQPQKQPLGPRLRKDLIEEALFQRRRDLFTGLRLVFIDTTSIYFEGEGGESLGKRGYSKDHRPDLKQMIVAVVMDDEGHPVCCELLPGNTSDVTTLVPVVDRLRKRFDIRNVCVVADRGMISEKTISELTQRGIHCVVMTIPLRVAARTDLVARASRGDDFGYSGEVDVSFSDVVEIVGERLPSDNRHDFGDLTVAITCAANSVEVFVAGPSAVLNKLSSEVKGGIDLTVRRRRSASVTDLVVAQPDRFPNRTMSGQAVAAAIGFRHSERDLFANCWGQQPAFQSLP